MPMAAGGALSGTAIREHTCMKLENLMEAVVERENMLSALGRVVSNKGCSRSGCYER
jgi:hypothetical protein